MVHLCPVVTWSGIQMAVWNRTEKACLWFKMSGIWMVRQVPWFYHLNTRHLHCPVLRWIRIQVFSIQIVKYSSNFRMLEFQSNVFSREWLWGSTDRDQRFGAERQKCETRLASRNWTRLDELSSSSSTIIISSRKIELCSTNWALTINWERVQNELVLKI